MKHKLYGLKLKRTGELLGFYTLNNPEDGECVDTSFVLESHCSNGRVWMVDDINVADYVRCHSTPWYNADYGTPSHSFNKEDIEVAEISLIY